MGIARPLIEVVKRLAAHSGVRVLDRRVGHRASPGALALAQADRYLPAAMLALLEEMNGLRFAWTFAGAKGAAAREPVGIVEIPTIQSVLRGRSFGDGYAVELPEMGESIRELDAGPGRAGIRFFPCAAEGDFGVWRRRDDVFDADPGLSVESYLERAAEALFIPAWLVAHLDGEPLPAEITEARRRLGFEPSAGEGEA